ncbi:peptide-methionine (S)-S-oxide reductase MsrA [Allosphingosinicella humi]
MPGAKPSHILAWAAFSLALAGCSPDYQPTLPGNGKGKGAAPSGQKATAIFAGGCFWCTESDFEKVPGVVAAVSGYTGGTLADPTYKQVSAGGTGHYEAVRITYDPARVSYSELVAYYFRTVDPTDAGGQFCDRGASYRTAIFVADKDERGIAETEKEEVAKELRRPVATMILPVARFYPAEGYHQDYYKKNSLKYHFYRTRCGRDARLREVWGRR